MILRKEVGCFPARIRSTISIIPAMADTIIELTWIICVDSSTAPCPRFPGMDALICNTSYCKTMITANSSVNIQKQTISSDKMN